MLGVIVLLIGGAFGYRALTHALLAIVSLLAGQEDSDEKLVIPMHRNLRRELALAKREHVVILTTAFGQPFSLKGFGCTKPVGGYD